MRAAPVVLVFGEESFLADREVAAIEAECGITDPQDMNRQFLDAAEATTDEVLASARTLPFLGDKRFIVVRNAAAWKVGDWETLIPYIEKPNPSTCLVLLSAAVDKRRAWWKALKKHARIVECKRPSDGDMPRWIRDFAKDAELELSGKVVQSLILRVGPDLQQLWREILKLQAYAGEDGRVEAEDVEALVGENRSTTVFVLCDGLGEKDAAKALGALRKLLELGEPGPRLLYMMVRHFRMLWKAWELGPGAGRNAASALGVPPFVANRLVQQARRWKEPAFESAFAEFVRADIELKSGGGAEVLHRLTVGLTTKK